MAPKKISASDGVTLVRLDRLPIDGCLEMFSKEARSNPDLPGVKPGHGDHGSHVMPAGESIAPSCLVRFDGRRCDAMRCDAWNLQRFALLQW